MGGCNYIKKKNYFFFDLIFFFDYFSIEMLLKLRHKNVCVKIMNEKQNPNICCYVLFSIDFPMPASFQMVPLKMTVLDIEGTKTYFFKVIINISFLFQLFI